MRDGEDASQQWSNPPAAGVYGRCAGIDYASCYMHEGEKAAQQSSRSTCKVWRPPPDEHKEPRPCLIH
jgi:hypothetical protein